MQSDMVPCSPTWRIQKNLQKESPDVQLRSLMQSKQRTAPRHLLPSGSSWGEVAFLSQLCMVHGSNIDYPLQKASLLQGVCLAFLSQSPNPRLHPSSLLPRFLIIMFHVPLSYPHLQSFSTSYPFSQVQEEWRKATFPSGPWSQGRQSDFYTLRMAPSLATFTSSF